MIDATALQHGFVVVARTPKVENFKTWRDKSVIEKLLKRIGLEAVVDRHPSMDSGNDDYKQFTWGFFVEKRKFFFILTSVGPDFEPTQRAFLGLLKSQSSGDILYDIHAGLENDVAVISDKDAKAVKDAVETILADKSSSNRGAIR